MEMEYVAQPKVEFKSKNLDAERKRRDKLNKKLYDLRAMVPKITKMTKATTIDDASDYIKALKKEVEDLQNELEEITNEEGETQARFSRTEKTDALQEMEKCKVEVVVKAIDANKFNIKLVCEKKQGWFTKLMETMTALGLEVTSINVTEFNGVVLNIICAQGSELEAIAEDQVREWLLEIASDC